MPQVFVGSARVAGTVQRGLRLPGLSDAFPEEVSCNSKTPGWYHTQFEINVSDDDEREVRDAAQGSFRRLKVSF